MAIDCYYTRVNNKWVRIYEPLSFSEFWVDISHAVSFNDERYYFSDLAAALEFYLEGWKGRQFENSDGFGEGLDHSGLYAHDRLIHGESIYGDAPGHDATVPSVTWF
jgi:hypothetical protein